MSCSFAAFDDYATQMTDDRERRFMMMLRQALLMVIGWIEKEYKLKAQS